MGEQIEQEQASRLSIETLKTGAESINTNYSFPEVIKFLEGLQTSVSINTARSKDELEVIFTSNSLVESTLNAIEPERPRSFIYLTDKCTEKSLKGGGTIKYPEKFIAAISLNKDAMLILRKVEKIDLLTLLPKQETKYIIKNILGYIPENWTFNTRHASYSSIQARNN